MSFDLGLHFIVGLSGTQINSSDKFILETIRPASIILFERNFSLGESYSVWISRIAKLIDDVKNIVNRDKLIISIDHEGGRVTRAPFPITRTPYAQTFKENAFKIGKIHSTEIKSLGANFSFAPVADIFSNPLNEVVGSRAFGNTPEEVSKYSIEYLKALKEEEILGCAKHFPGHGDTAIDSHFLLPVINSSLEELQKHELLTFKSLIDVEVETIMTAHILFPSIDEQPATFSHKILNKILRNELGFKGVIISDDIEMLAVADEFEKEDGIIEAFNAGCDVFIASRNRFSTKGRNDLTFITYNNLKNGVNSKKISMQKLEDSERRITTLLNSAKEYTPYMIEKSVFTENYNFLLDTIY